jgi:hypothetical protein
MEREALKLALEALEESQTDNDTMEFWDRKSKAITAIQTALAQPAQKPVAWMCSAFDGEPCEQTNHDECGNPIPLYTAPPQRPWVGLTDEETQAYWDWEDWQTGAGRSTILEMVRDIEARLRSKNT